MTPEQIAGLEAQVERDVAAIAHTTSISVAQWSAISNRWLALARHVLTQQAQIAGLQAELAALKGGDA